MSGVKKRTVAVIGLLLLGVVFGNAGSKSQDSASRGPDEIDRRPKSVEDLLFDLKKYHRLDTGSYDEREETRAALVAMGRPIVPRLCEALCDKDRYGRRERADVAQVLGEIGDPRAAGALIEAIAEPGGPSLSYLASALEKVGCDEIEPLIELLKGDDSQSQWKAMEVFWHLQDPRAVEPLLDVFENSPSPKVRWHAASTLGGIGDRRAVEPILMAIEDCSDPDGIYRMAGALGSLGDPRAVEPLIAIMNRDPEKWAGVIVGPLGDLRDGRAVEPLLGLIDKPYRYVAEEAVKALGKIGGEKAAIGLLQARKAWHGKSSAELREAGLSPYQSERALVATGAAAVEPLLAELEDPKSPIRVEAARLLGEIGDRRAFDPLLAATREEDYKLRSEAIGALGRLGDPRAAETIATLLEKGYSASTTAWALASLDPPAYDLLYKALKHEHWSVRAAVARTLAERSDPKTLPTLIELYPREVVENRRWVPSEPGQVRRYILRAFEESGTSEHVPFLIEALKDGEAEVRREAIPPLGKIRDPRAVPPLIEALEDPSPLVVEDAVKALGQIADARAAGPLVDVLARQKQEISYEVDGLEYSGTVTRRRTFWENSNAERALIQIGGPSVRPLLAELEGPRYHARCGAVRVLGRLRDLSAVEPLIRTLDHKDGEIRILAAAALAEIGDGRAVRPLLEMAIEPSQAESSAAAEALWALGLDAIDPLISALDDDNNKIRQHAAQALKEIGEPRALAAIKAR